MEDIWWHFLKLQFMKRILCVYCDVSFSTSSWSEPHLSAELWHVLFVLFNFLGIDLQAHNCWQTFFFSSFYFHSWQCAIFYYLLRFLFFYGWTKEKTWTVTEDCLLEFKGLDENEMCLPLWSHHFSTQSFADVLQEPIRFYWLFPFIIGL